MERQQRKPLVRGGVACHVPNVRIQRAGKCEPCSFGTVGYHHIMKRDHSIPGGGAPSTAQEHAWAIRVILSKAWQNLSTRKRQNE